MTTVKPPTRYVGTISDRQQSYRYEVEAENMEGAMHEVVHQHFRDRQDYRTFSATIEVVQKLT
jgi:hypothetical protein